MFVENFHFSVILKFCYFLKFVFVVINRWKCIVYGCDTYIFVKTKFTQKVFSFWLFLSHLLFLPRQVLYLKIVPLRSINNYITHYNFCIIFMRGPDVFEDNKAHLSVFRFVKVISE